MAKSSPSKQSSPRKQVDASFASTDFDVSDQDEECAAMAFDKKLAPLEESSYGSSDLDDIKLDYSHHEATSLGSTMASSVTSTALTVIGIPRYILASKWLVAGILVSSTCILGYFVFAYTNNQQTQDFKEMFADYADQMVDQSLNNLINTFSVLASFSNTITSLVLFANTSFPLISLPHFETRASDFLLLSKAQQVALAPLVPDICREDWETYTVAHQDWIQEGMDYEYMVASTTEASQLGQPNGTGATTILVERASPIPEYIWKQAPSTHQPVVERSKGPHMPIWQTYPTPRSALLVNFNLLSTPEFQQLQQVATRDRQAVLSGIVDNDFLLLGANRTNDLDPRSVLLQPIFESFEAHAPVVAFVVVVMTWDTIFQEVLHSSAEPIVFVLSNDCGQVVSYEVSGQDVTFLGEGDWHNEKYDPLVVTSDLSRAESAPSLFTSLCSFTLQVYPTEALEVSTHTDMPAYITLAVISMFAFTTLMFLLYDLMVQRNQSTLAATAMRTSELLGNMFPQEVHDRLFDSNLTSNDKAHSAPKFQMRRMITDGDDNKKLSRNDQDVERAQKNAPIADLFPECTVLFCDIAGFTAWSSTREPCQVFMLLETVYNAFDILANKRGVFKVETIGDSYLAVTGLPTPREDHAVAMVKFANDCLIKMQELAQTLELELGPGTGELTMRFGLHSGPVTAGVLRGEKTRFQLFGDTVNTASRMESTGERDKIQVSQETADLIIAAGRERWIKPRETKITAKGKGELQTFWVNPRVQTGLDTQGCCDTVNSTRRSKSNPMSMVGVSQLHGTIASASGLDERKKRSVHWISDIMVKLLKQIMARRTVSGASSGWNLNINLIAGSSTKKVPMNNDPSLRFLIAQDKDLVVDELQDIITLPTFDKSLARKQVDPDKIKLPDAALEQLRSYISAVALLYNDNPFHNIDHAAHVTMSVVKLLARIVAPETLDPAKENGSTFEARRHDHTYGITSDPLTQFAVVFTALIHDADHPGCPNASLVKEKTQLAVRYENKSVAEQHSFDICWDMLMEEKYKELRACIYETEEEGKRFRQLVVNSIIATDISDKNLSTQRKARWQKAFHPEEEAGTFQDESDGGKSEEELANEAINRKATIVIEHLIQASDIAHTMQHWHIYTKWNEKLFQEMHKAFLDGHLEKDPSESWYQGELGFYDFYIIPLAKKLHECGVFGVSSAEYLNYATANRKEWEERGKEIVSGYVKKYANKPSAPPTSPKPARKRHSVGFSFGNKPES